MQMPTIKPINQKELIRFHRKEGDANVSLCPLLDIASQGKAVEKTRQDLLEALKLFFVAVG
jgi:predicted RNase H-like HicB family nuclease